MTVSARAAALHLSRRHVPALAGFGNDPRGMRPERRQYIHPVSRRGNLRTANLASRGVDSGPSRQSSEGEVR
jgi:hypothetical protein